MSIEMLKEKGRRLRIHSLRATTQAGSGHPSSCLSAADLVSTIFFHEMRWDPKDPANPANDRFILSKGHAAPVLYAAWVEAGIYSPETVLELRRLDSDFEGHPTPRLPWVDVATGSLGQGLSAGVGEALVARLDGNGFDVFVVLGDGECAEGSVWEAAEIAAYYKTSNLYAIVDVNSLGQSQHTMDGFDVERFANKFRAFGWHAVTVDGHDYEQILSAFENCRKEGGDKPRAIVAKTLKGKGVSFMENKDGWHGKAVSKSDIDKALGELSQPFSSEEWKPNPRQAPSRSRVESNLRAFATSRKPGEQAATREAYGDALAKLVQLDPRIIALDGDTKNSTFSEKVLKAKPEAFVECFIAEQNMIGMGMGMAARGRIPFISTFAAFLTRGYDQIRMAGVSMLNIKFCGSHCGASIGEDGPSQMGLEDLAMFRPIPGCVVLYPSDAISAERLVVEAAAYNGMCYIRTTRPKTALLYSNDEEFPIGGSKTVRQSANDFATVVGAGITVHEALKAADALAKEGLNVRVIDAYSVKPIDAKTLIAAARDTGGRIIVVEDHYADGGLGDAVLNAVGSQAKVMKLAVREIPHSGPPEALLDKYGISASHIVETVKKLK